MPPPPCSNAGLSQRFTTFTQNIRSNIAMILEHFHKAVTIKQAFGIFDRDPRAMMPRNNR